MVECVSCVDIWILGVSPQVLEKWLSQCELYRYLDSGSITTSIREMVECVSCVDIWILGVSPQVLEKRLSV